ncbi:unnamed protein product [Arctogadus glacialis]
MSVGELVFMASPSLACDGPREDSNDFAVHAVPELPGVTVPGPRSLCLQWPGCPCHGLSQVERNRFENLKDHVRRLRARPDPEGHGQGAVKKMLEEFSLQYTYPQCSEPRNIQDMDRAQNTVEDLMLRICHLENVGNSKGVCLYTVDGMPLTNDPFLNTWQSVFLSSLYSVRSEMCGGNFKKVVAYIRQLTGCNPLAQSLYQLICKNEIVTKTQKNQSTAHENYAPIKLTSEQGHPFCEPINVPGTPVVFERAYVLQKIRDGGTIPNCSEVDLQESSLKRDTDLEKILLSLPPFIKTYHLWLSHADVSGENFQVNMKETFANMTEKLTEFPFLQVTPPLQLKEAGQPGKLPVLLSEDNLCICLYKDKLKPQDIKVLNFLSGKVETVNLDELAASTGNLSDGQTFITCRTPKEAILVLIDTSTSMRGNCYDDLKMRKIDAAKELFDSFASRTMAYDFQHLISLVSFSSDVKLIHTFTENLEVFKEHLRDLKLRRNTVLYDALQHGVNEMEAVKKRFPECRLRIICLTDGQDFGSTVKPETVAVNLIKSNIIVDCILLGNGANKYTSRNQQRHRGLLFQATNKHRWPQTF